MRSYFAPALLGSVLLMGSPAAFAALLSRRYQPKPSERVGVLVCGGNTTAVDFSRGAATAQSLARPGRGRRA